MTKKGENKFQIITMPPFKFLSDLAHKNINSLANGK